MLIITRVLAPHWRPRYFVVLGLACISLHFFYQSQVATGAGLPAAFDSRWLNWLGLVSHKPATEDFVPLLPWLGVMLLGAAIGLGLRTHTSSPMANWPSPVWAKPLVFLGQHSLGFYLLHQPVFWGLLYLAAALGFRP